MNPPARNFTRFCLVVAIMAVVFGYGAIGLITSASPAEAAVAPTATACTGALAKFRADAPPAQLTRAAPISKKQFTVELPINQPGWAHACVSGYWIETQYLDLGIANASSTATPTLVPITRTPTAAISPTPAITPTPVTGTEPPGLWITFNGVSQFCPLPCTFTARSNRP